MDVPNKFVGKRIGNNHIELVSVIGQGSYGCVYRAILHQDGRRKACAVKCLAKHNLDAYHLMCQRREILLHKQVSDGDNIVTLYQAFEDSDYQWIVMEYSSDGDLWDWISDGLFNGEDERLKDVFIQILNAVEYCHSKHVFHRDIKPENVLLTDGGRKVLLADFGLASGSPMSNELRCGSPWYMSPECWGGIYGTSTSYATASNDVWCLGILLINLACGRHAPWRHAHPHDTYFQDFMKQPEMLRLFLPQLSSEVLRLLRRVFVLNPSTRISIQDFRAAVSKIKHFTRPVKMRSRLHDTQRAVRCSKLGPAVSYPHRHIVRAVLSTSLPLVTSHREESVDITDAAHENITALNPPACKESRSFVRHIPIIDTAPQVLRVSTARSWSSSRLLEPSSSASGNSLWPVTPQMVAAAPEVEVLDISDTADNAILPPPATPAKVVNVSVSPATVPFQNLLRAICAI